MKISLSILIFISGLNLIESYNYSDSCYYIDTHYPCGDVCLNGIWNICICGQVPLRVKITDWNHLQYCCTPPSVKCKKTLQGAYCPEGEVNEAEHFYIAYPEKFDVAGSIPCYGQCYNDYHTSEYLGIYSHYTCPDKCVHWSGMCRGVSYCEGDQEICGEDLRCPQFELGNFTKHTMATDPPRAYCFGWQGVNIGQDDVAFADLVENDGGYDNLDRSDEDIKIETGSKPNINYTALELCIDLGPASNLYGHGVKCGDTCLGVEHWCMDYEENFCDYSHLTASDPILCSNKTFWQNISCDLSNYNDQNNPSVYKGKRCSGTMQHCYYPFNNQLEFHPWEEDITYYPRTCLDKSDRVFLLTEICPDTPANLCKDGWNNTIPCPEQLCWESCAHWGPNCLACTNTTYFQCPISGQCIHPELQCDGHPQCVYGEDENLDVCYDKYKASKVISKYATFRCKSIMYSIMETYATACNDFPECADEEDEKLCSDNTALFIILPTTMAFLALIYLILKFGRFTYHYCKERNQKVYSFNIHLVEEIFETYLENHGKDNKDDDMINSLLLHIIYTKSAEEIKDVCKKLYALESEVHNNNVNDVYCCLHKNLDPVIVEVILENQFPGFIKKCVEYFENLKGIRTLVDFLDENRFLILFKDTIVRLVKIELEYLDILKDSFLAFSLFTITGGYNSIIKLPSHFANIVVLCFFASVVIPIFFATLHLVIHNPFMVFYIMPSETINSRIKKTVMTLLCCLLSFLNPVLLVNAYEGAKDRTKAMAKSMNAELVQQMDNLNKIKHQWVTFIKIELGM